MRSLTFHTHGTDNPSLRYNIRPVFPGRTEEKKVHRYTICKRLQQFEVIARQRRNPKHTDTFGQAMPAMRTMRTILTMLTGKRCDRISPDPGPVPRSFALKKKAPKLCLPMVLDTPVPTEYLLRPIDSICVKSVRDTLCQLQLLQIELGYRQGIDAGLQNLLFPDNRAAS